MSTYAPLPSPTTSSPAFSPSPNLSRILPDKERHLPSRASTSSSSTSVNTATEYKTSNGYLTAERSPTIIQTSFDSEDTLSPSRTSTIRAKGKGKERAEVNGYGHWENPVEGDVGDMLNRNDTVKTNNKGKEKERNQVWDEEQGRVEDIYGYHVEGGYPPTNEEEEEERRIQENLARMAAADMARRRASRLSKQIQHMTPTNQDRQGQTQSQSRPTSLLSMRTPSESSVATKRSSLFGLVGSMWGSSGRMDTIDDGGEVPLDPTAPLSRQSSASYLNPYDPNSNSRPSSHTPTSKVNSFSSSRSTESPSSPTAGKGSIGKSPFDDPDPPTPTSSRPYADIEHQYQNGRHNRTKSTMTDYSDSPEQGFSYTGPSWRGGGGAAGGGDGVGDGELRLGGERREKWWYALCAWGEDLDGGHGDDPDGQMGRTNPME